MRISSKGEYAVISMLYLAQKYESGEFVSLSEIATNNKLSLKYLEKIFSKLKEKDFFISERGKYGGYKLKYKPSSYLMYDIVRYAEDRLALFSCLEGKDCNKGECLAFSFWNDLYKSEINFLKSKTLNDYMMEGING